MAYHGGFLKDLEILEVLGLLNLAVLRRSHPHWQGGDAGLAVFRLFLPGFTLLKTFFECAVLGTDLTRFSFKSALLGKLCFLP